MVGTRDARLNVLRAVPILAVISLVGTTVYTVGTFGLAAVQGVPRASLWAQGLADPTAQRCAAAGATEVLDPYTAVPLAEAAGLPAPPARDRVRRERAATTRATARREPRHVGCGAASWRPTAAARTATEGAITTPWYALPAEGTVTLLAAGSLSDGSTLTVEYGRRVGRHRRGGRHRGILSDSAARPVVAHADPGRAGGGRRDAGDRRRRVRRRSGAGWRSRRPPRPGRCRCRRSCPATRRWRWRGSTRSPGPASGSPGSSTGSPSRRRSRCCGAAEGRCRDARTATWQAFRGGAFAQVPRSQSVLQLATVEPVDADT